MSARRGRGVGLSAFAHHTTQRSSYAHRGAALRSSHGDSLATQLSVFQQLLHNFALQHGEHIKRNPTFRAEFARMCSAIGVDPLAGSNAEAGGGGGGGGDSGYGSGAGGKKKGGGSAAAEGGKKTWWWNQVMGSDVGDFYFAVGVRVVEVCRETRDENGGLLGVAECREKVGKGKVIGGGMEVSDDDILRAVKSLGPLGSGFSIVEIGRKLMIRSIPKELNTDQQTVLEAVQVLGYVTASMLEDNLNWEAARAQTVLEDLLAGSLLWVDAKAREKEYWTPLLFDDSLQE